MTKNSLWIFRFLNLFLFCLVNRIQNWTFFIKWINIKCQSNSLFLRFLIKFLCRVYYKLKMYFLTIFFYEVIKIYIIEKRLNLNPIPSFIKFFHDKKFAKNFLNSFLFFLTIHFKFGSLNFILILYFFYPEDLEDKEFRFFLED